MNNNKVNHIMKKTIILLFGALIAASLFKTFYCWGSDLADALRQVRGTCITGSGSIVTREITADDFDEVKVGKAVKAVIVPAGEAQCITLRADDNIIDLITVCVDGRTLKIGSNCTRAFCNVTIEARIPDNGHIRSLKASGASSILHRGVVCGDEAEIECSGASKIEASVAARRCEVEMSGASKGELSVEADELEADVSGASKLSLRGKARRADMEASGASKIAAEELVAADCAVEAGGASSCRVNCTGTLDAEAGGASSIRYAGDCRTTNIRKSGASSIKKL